MVKIAKIGIYHNLRILVCVYLAVISEHILAIWTIKQWYHVCSQLFAQIPAKARLKVEAIEGDCGSPGLGLSDQERCLLVSKIHVVIHAAATVRFDEKLPLAVNINVKGTQEMLDLARDMPNLEVGLGTAFF